MGLFDLSKGEGSRTRSKIFRAEWASEWYEDVLGELEGGGKEVGGGWRVLADMVIIESFFGQQVIKIQTD